MQGLQDPLLNTIICRSDTCGTTPFIFGQPKTTRSTDFTKIDKNREYYFGAAMAFVSAISASFHYVIVGRLLKNSTTNSATLLAFHGGFGGLLVIIPALLLNTDQRLFSSNIANINPSTWAALSTVAVLGLTAFVAVNLAIKQINPILVSFVHCIEIVFAYIAQVCLFNMMPDIFGIIGSILVIVTVCALPFEELIPKESCYLCRRFQFNNHVPK